MRPPHRHDPRLHHRRPSDADTTPASTTGPPDPAKPAVIRIPAQPLVHRLPRHPIPARHHRHRHAPSRTSSTARYRCSTTPSSTSTPGSLRHNQRDRRETNQALKSREPARSVAHLPELLSPTYRNRVRKLSPRNRNQGVQHLPDSHIRRTGQPRHVDGPVSVVLRGRRIAHRATAGHRNGFDTDAHQVTGPETGVASARLSRVCASATAGR